MLQPHKRRIYTFNTGLRWWLLLAFHAIVFGLFVFFYEDIRTLNPEILTNNRLRLIIPAWTGLLLLHLLYVWIIALRMGRKRKRDSRIRQRLLALPDPSMHIPQLPSGTYVMPMDDELDDNAPAYN